MEHPMSALYTYENARAVSTQVLALFTPEAFSKAVTAAMVDQNERMQEGRVFVYAPCNLDTITPRSFADMLAGPALWAQEGHSLRQAEPIEKARIYGTYADALQGRHSVTGLPYNGFFVVDSGTKLVVDMTDRAGKSILHPTLIKLLHENIEKQLRYSIKWEGASATTSENQAPVAVPDEDFMGR